MNAELFKSRKKILPGRHEAVERGREGERSKTRSAAREAGHGAPAMAPMTTTNTPIRVCTGSEGFGNFKKHSFVLLYE